MQHFIRLLIVLSMLFNNTTLMRPSKVATSNIHPVNTLYSDEVNLVNDSLSRTQHIAKDETDEYGNDDNDEKEPETIIVDDGINNDELFANYVEQAFNNEVKKPTFMKKAAKKGAYINLNIYQKYIYDEFLKNIKANAAGTLDSTIYNVDFSLKEEPFTWTSEDLGGITIAQEYYGNYYPTQEAINIIKEQIGVDSRGNLFDPHRIIRSLLLDVPYEFYWYNKTLGTSVSINPDFQVDSTGTTISLVGGVRFSFPVASEFQDNTITDPTVRTYTVNKNIGTSISTSIENAVGIVEKHANKSEYQRLISYRDEICGLTSYNDYALTV